METDLFLSQPQMDVRGTAHFGTFFASFQRLPLGVDLVLGSSLGCMFV